METTTELILNPNDPAERGMMIVERQFALQQRKAQALAASKIVPTIYQNDIPNCMIAMELAERLHTGVLEIMQNLYVVHGNPAFSSKYLIAMINMSNILTGRLRFIMVGQAGKDDYGCYAVGTEAATGNELIGTTVTVKMARDQGWYGKTGSKWPSMTDQMLQYRAAAFWSRINAPEATMGMMTTEEQEDISERDITPGAHVEASSVNEMLKGKAVKSQVIEHEKNNQQAETIEGGQQATVEKEVASQPEWPKFDDGIWCDSAGANYDSNQHLFPEGADHPTVNADGTFRKRPAKKAVLAQGETETKPLYTGAFIEIENQIGLCEVQGDFERVISMGQWANLAEGEHQRLHAIIEKRKEDLAFDFI